MQEAGLTQNKNATGRPAQSPRGWRAIFLHEKSPEIYRADWTYRHILSIW